MTAASANTRPIVISSLFSDELNNVFAIGAIDPVKVFDHHLEHFETIPGSRATRRPGSWRSQDNYPCFAENLPAKKTRNNLS
ncbi:hypothetical protein [Desulforhopalus singaporensis]|uniref:Uncharacterized protein n=1 Tax=Desulforhopalus singaporensis TaxID=91360 RepID=A0A1H0QKY9_9BACT|nr:hypothetical protein [Desulforhopalus singaporensis]SDP18051.1 hypothetical protein SAMN05660330_02015 [Desulforhopalus singaporensis]